MNAYQDQIARLKECDESELDVLRELRTTRSAREEVRTKANDDWMSRLPYSSKPEFLGERWKLK